MSMMYRQAVSGYYHIGAVSPLDLFTIHSLIALALQGPTIYQLPNQLPVTSYLTNDPLPYPMTRQGLALSILGSITLSATYCPGLDPGPLTY